MAFRPALQTRRLQVVGGAASQGFAAPHSVGRYTLFDEIAAGGMGVVHFGRLTGSGGFERVVAIKRAHAVFASDPEFVDMFREEVRLVSRIRHPNVVAALDVIEHAGELLLVMEYVHGESLSRLAHASRRLSRPIPLNIAVTIMCGALRGLEAAHSAKSAAGDPLGIVHRDVSPQNILVGCDGVPRLLDFGVARAERSLSLTHAGHVKGKLGYAAPERLSTGDVGVDARADVYSASVVLWELLASRRLFDCKNERDVVTRVLEGRIEPIGDHQPASAPGKVEAIVMKGLHKNPDERFSSAGEMARALEREVETCSPTTLGEWVSVMAEDSLAERSRQFAWAENSVLLPEGSASRPIRFLPWSSEKESCPAPCEAEPTVVDPLPTPHDHAAPIAADPAPSVGTTPSKSWMMTAAIGATALFAGAMLALGYGQAGTSDTSVAAPNVGALQPSLRTDTARAEAAQAPSQAVPSSTPKLSKSQPAEADKPAARPRRTLSLPASKAASVTRPRAVPKPPRSPKTRGRSPDGVDDGF